MTPHPESESLIKELMDTYSDVFQGQYLARDVDPEERGPWGIARIELKEGAVAKKTRPFRMPPDREQALAKLIQGFVAKGWVEPSKSEWSAQAFIVPKPDDPTNPEKQWRMVVDYRYLNS